LVLLLFFVRALLKGPRPIHWRRFSMGVFVEKTRDARDAKDDKEER
jgi:hypothetical protein